MTGDARKLTTTQDADSTVGAQTGPLQLRLRHCLKVTREILDFVVPSNRFRPLGVLQVATLNGLFCHAAPAVRIHLQVMNLAVRFASGRHTCDRLPTCRGRVCHHSMPGARNADSVPIRPFAPRRHTGPADSVLSISPTAPKRSTPGVPYWLDSACGTLTVKGWSKGCGKEKTR